MTFEVALAIVLGGAFGLGVCLLVSLAPRWGAPSLASRIAPYIRDVTEPRGVSLDPSGRVLDVVTALRAARDAVGRRLGGSESTARRLRQAGWAMDASAFRGRQLAWASAGLAVGGAGAVALVLTGAATAPSVLLPVVCAAAAWLLCDVVLSRAARARVSRIEEELPTVLEFLALCLSAGEGILDSLRRIGDVGSGELTSEVRGVVLAVGTGSPLSESLTRLGQRVQVPALTRALDQIVAALERGAPLAQVLHAQAHDAREDAKRGLIEQAGRKEIQMLIPLVFVVLPLSVVFAVFPGVFMLRLGIG